MKKIYTILFVGTALLFSGCSKDILKQYEKRIIGTWRITDVKSLGIGGDEDHLPFQSGSLTFNEDRSLVYISPAGDLYNGNWDIDKNWGDSENTRRTLQITAVDFNSQKVLSELYEEMNFRSTDHFVGYIHSGAQSYVTHFRR